MSTLHVLASLEKYTGIKQVRYQLHQQVVTSIFFCLLDDISNYIDTILIPSRTKERLLKAYIQSTSMLKSRGLEPRLRRLDNEASTLLKDYM